MAKPYLEIRDEHHQGEWHQYKLTLPGAGTDIATIVIDRVTDEKQGIWGEVSVMLLDEIVVPPSRTNLMNATRSGWRAHTDVLEERHGQAEWHDAFREVVNRTISQHRKGDPAKALRHTASTGTFHPFILEPLVAGRGVTVLYGEGGMGKSLLALAVALSVASGWPIFGKVPVEVGPVLYFDYEDDTELHDRRLAGLMAGIGLTELAHPIYHKALIGKVSSAQAEMRRAVNEAKAKLVVLDSIGMGRGGDANTAEDTIRMFRALRSLTVPVLALDHIAKSDKREGTKVDLQAMAPYGSVYTMNSARLLWGGLVADASTQQVRRVQLLNTKANHVRRQEPFGVSIEYHPDPLQPQVFREITVNVFDEMWEEFAMTSWERIHAVLLMSTEFLSVNELSLRTSIKPDTVRKELNRHDEQLEEMQQGREKRVRLR